MQVIYKNKDEGNNNGGVDTMDLIICTGGIGRYIEEEYAGRLGRRITRI